MKETLTEEQQKQFEKLKNYESPFKFDRFGETRVIYFEPLRKAIEVSQSLGLSRDGSEINLNHIGEDVGHVATLVIEDHKNFIEVAGERLESPKHHRILLQCFATDWKHKSTSAKNYDSEKYENTLKSNPLEYSFDIVDSMWQSLPLASEYIKVLQQLQANNTQIVTKMYQKYKSGYEWTARKGGWEKNDN